MKTKDEALKMAIEVMQAFDNQLPTNSAKQSIQACKEALEQPAQEPVAWMPRVGQIEGIHKMTDGIPLYTHPAPSWQGLSDEEIIEKCAPIWGAIINTRDREETVDFARAIEKALKEKNG